MYSTLLRIALRVSTCIIHVQLAESRPEGQCFMVRTALKRPGISEVGPKRPYILFEALKRP